VPEKFKRYLQGLNPADAAVLHTWLHEAHEVEVWSEINHAVEHSMGYGGKGAPDARAVTRTRAFSNSRR
jgi:hypothetical protein